MEEQELEKKEEPITEDALEEAPTEESLMAMEDSSEAPLDEDENSFAHKKLMIRFIFLLAGFILTTLIYFICKAFDPFKGVTDQAEVQSYAILTYIKYFMYVMIVVALASAAMLVVIICKVKIPWIKANLTRIVDILEWVIIFPVCIALTTFCFCFLFTFTIVDGRSMEPNFKPNEQLVLTYPKEYNRFDVVVIDVTTDKYPNLKTLYRNDYHSFYIKRIIGMPGDYIEYRPTTVSADEMWTILYVNGKEVDESFYTDEEKSYYHTFQTAHSGNTFHMEDVCDISSEKCVDNGTHFVIPEGYYLVLGDNRTNSIDSRVIGLVCEDDLVGRISYRMDGLFKFKKLS